MRESGGWQIGIVIDGTFNTRPPAPVDGCELEADLFIKLHTPEGGGLGS